MSYYILSIKEVFLNDLCARRLRYETDDSGGPDPHRHSRLRPRASADRTGSGSQARSSAPRVVPSDRQRAGLAPVPHQAVLAPGRKLRDPLPIQLGLDLRGDELQARRQEFHP